MSFAEFIKRLRPRHEGESPSFHSSGMGSMARWRALSIAVVGGMVATALLIAYFMYQHIYATITNSNSVIALSSDLHVLSVKTETFEKAEKLLELKAATPAWPDSFRAMFQYGVPTRPASSTTSSAVIP